MHNMIDAARRQLDELLRNACAAAAAAGTLPPGAALSGDIGLSEEPQRGDLACTHALASAGALGLPPRRVAEALLSALRTEGSFFAGAEAAGPGFLNFRLGESWYAAVLAACAEEEGPPPLGQALTAAPVPQDADGLRAALCADALGRILERLGWTVTREPFDAAELAACAEAAARRGFDRAVLFFAGGTPLQTDGGTALVPCAPLRLIRDGRPVGAGRDFPAEALLGELGPDAARFFLCSGADVLDLDLAVRRDGGNPFYAARYAYARLGTLLARFGGAAELSPEAAAPLLDAEAERALLRRLAAFPETLRRAAEAADPARLCRYLTLLTAELRLAALPRALSFRSPDPVRSAARLLLAAQTRRILGQALDTLGVGSERRESL